MKRFYILLATVLLAAFSAITTRAKADEQKVKVGIEDTQFLGKYVPLDAEFTNSDGYKKSLRELITKPTVLALVYYHCPGICSPLLTNLSKVVDECDLVPGENYNILSISFDPTESFNVAAKWKKQYLDGMDKKVPQDAWHFMVGDSTNIKKLTNSVGFYYKPDGNGDFIHSGCLIMLSPEGKITRYLMGTQYLPFDFKMAITESSKGIATPPIAKVLATCFSYDPKGNKYVFDFNKVTGAAVFLFAGIFLTFLIIKGRKKSKKGADNV